MFYKLWLLNVYVIVRVGFMIAFCVSLLVTLCSAMMYFSDKEDADDVLKTVLKISTIVFAVTAAFLILTPPEDAMKYILGVR